MKEYIGTWNKGDEYKEVGKAGKLVVDEDSISLHLESCDFFVKGTFISRYNHRYIKAYSNGLYNGLCNIYQYVLFNNSSDLEELKGDKIESISECLLYIPNIIEWFNIKCLHMDKSFTVSYLMPNPVLIKNNECIIEYKFLPELPMFDYPFIGNSTKVTMENKPYIHILYKTSVDIERLEADIKKLARFFSLLIGRIDGISEIRFKTENSKSWFEFYNRIDYTHLTNSNVYNSGISPIRTTYEDIGENLPLYYNKWVDFYEIHELLIDNFHKILGKKSSSIQDQFLTWCRFLDGYYIRKYEDSQKSDIIKKQIISILKGNDIEKLFKEAFKEVQSEYNRNNIAKWIQKGFLERVSFGDKVRKIDGNLYKLVEKNIEYILREDIDNKMVIFSKINATRNFYSHFKDDNKGCLSFAEIYRINDILYVLIISILLNEIGIEYRKVYDILRKDSLAWSYIKENKL